VAFPRVVKVLHHLTDIGDRVTSVDTVRQLPQQATQGVLLGPGEVSEDVVLGVPQPLFQVRQDGSSGACQDHTPTTPVGWIRAALHQTGLDQVIE